MNLLRAFAGLGLTLLVAVAGAQDSRASAPEPRPPTELQDADLRSGLPRIETGTGRISGRVTDEGGRSLGQATVTVRAASGASKVTSTDAGGGYQFTELPAGRYSLTASKATYITLDYGQSDRFDVATRLELEDDQTIDEIDLALPRAGVIAGRVVDEFGEPVPNARVISMLKRIVGGRQRFLETGQTAVTNDIGEFRLAGLLPGPCYLAVFGDAPETLLDSPRARIGYAATYFPGTVDALAAQPVTVRLSETVTVGDMTLRAAPLATVSGWATDEGGDFRRTGSVIAVDRSGSMLPLATSVSAPIRSDGTFETPGVPLGEYVLYTSPDQSKKMLTAAVRMAGADVTGVALTRLRDVAVSGRVVLATPGASSARPTMVRLMLSPLSQEGFLESRRFDSSTLWVDEDFTFHFTAPATEIAVQALPTSPQWAVRAIRLNGVDVTDIGLDLRSGGNVSDLEIELTTRPPTLSVGVTDATDRAASRYTLLVFPQDQTRWLSPSAVLVNTVRGVGSRLVTRRMPPGAYLALALDNAEASGDLREPEFLETVRSRATVFSLSDGDTKMLDLKVHKQP